jgi:hypothetical protein
VPSLSPSSNLSENPNGNPVLSLDPSFNPLDSSSSTQMLRDVAGDDDDEDGNGNSNDDNDDDDNDNDDSMRLQNFGLNDVDGMSEYELMRVQIVDRNNARLASLGLLGRTSSATPPPPFDLPNRKKHAAPQDDVERRVQPKRNAKKSTSYRDFDNHVIYKRT